MVDLPPAHHRGLDALAALVVAETGVGHVGHLGEPEGGVQLPPHAVPVQFLLVLAHRGPQPGAQHDLRIKIDKCRLTYMIKVKRKEEKF